MSQKQMLFQMVGFHLPHHLELTASQHLLLWMPSNNVSETHSVILKVKVHITAATRDCFKSDWNR